MSIKGFFKGVWQFCKYLFVLKKQPKDYGQDGWLEEQFAKQSDN